MEELMDGLYRTGSWQKTADLKITIGLLDAFNNRKLSDSELRFVLFSKKRVGD
jgi:hypothetical protein